MRDTTLMLSGIWDLEWKCVKKLGQRFWSLFIGAQKTMMLAFHLWNNDWEKHPRAFLEVVEGYEMYSFGIHCLEHFSSKIWRESLLNRVTPNGFGTGPRVRAHAWRRVRLAAQPTDQAQTSVHRCDHRSHNPTPTSTPSSSLPRAAHPQAEQTDLRRPTNGRTAVPRPLCMRWSWPPPQGTTTYLRPPRLLSRGSMHRRRSPGFRRPRHGRRRRAHYSACDRCHLSLFRASPHAHQACTPACWPNQTACSPENNFPLPPESSRWWARSPAWTLSQLTLLATPLGRPEASTTTCCPVEPSPSPDFVSLRPCCPCAAVLPLRRRRCSPATSPAEPSAPIKHEYAQSQPRPACCPSPGPTSLPASLPSPSGT
jgi:hypothetical protein